MKSKKKSCELINIDLFVLGGKFKFQISSKIKAFVHLFVTRYEAIILILRQCASILPIIFFKSEHFSYGLILTCQTSFSIFKREYPGGFKMVGTYSMGLHDAPGHDKLAGNPGFKTSTWETNIGITMITML